MPPNPGKYPKNPKNPELRVPKPCKYPKILKFFRLYASGLVSGLAWRLVSSAENFRIFEIFGYGNGFGAISFGFF